MIDFKEIYNNCVLRSNYEIVLQTYFDMKERGIDVVSHIKHGIVEEIKKQIYEKIQVKLLNFKNEEDLDKWYERWINNETHIKYPLAKLESELCVFTKKELYEFWHVDCCAVDGRHLGAGYSEPGWSASRTSRLRDL